MWLLVLVTLLLVVYGSLFPFDFRYVALTPEIVGGLLSSWRQTGGWANVLGNLMLFFPLGFAGMLAFPGRRRWRTATLVALGGGVLALGLQLGQIYLPRRVPALGDTIINCAGLLTGIAAGEICRVLLLGGAAGRRQLRPDGAPLLLVALWLAERLFPYVPALHWQNIKDSLKPLLVEPTFTVEAFLKHGAGWLVVAVLLARVGGAQHAAIRLAALGLAVIAAQILIVYNSVKVTDFAALAAAVAVYQLVVRGARSPALAVLPFVAVALAWNGLQPLAWLDEPRRFLWLPFEGALGGAMLLNAAAMLYKFFFYGALAWLALHAAGPHAVARAAAVAAATAFVAAIELAQIHLPGRTPEITDPLLVLLAAALIVALERTTPVPRPDRAAA